MLPFVTHNMQRRMVLASMTAATLPLAGCTSFLSSNEFGPAESPWGQENDTNLQNGYEYSGELTLPPNRFADINITPRLRCTVSLKANASSPMDFYILTENEFNRYRDGNDFRVVSEKLAADGATSPNLSGEISAGSYYAVFDNAAFTATEPDGEVTANYRLRWVV